MAFSITLLSETREELKKIIVYYNEISPELAEDFGKKLYNSMEIINTSPLSFRKIKRHYRKMNLERFPYKIIFRVENDMITVVAVAHEKRRQFYWIGRL